MNILRQTPFPLTVEYTDLDPEVDYQIEIYDDRSTLLISETVTTDIDGTLSYDLPADFSKFDDTYSLYVYSMTLGVVDESVVIDNLYIYRPYVNPETYTSIDYDTAVYSERVARTIIDTITGGFYYEKKTEEITGLGSDYLPSKHRLNKVNYVYQNNVLAYNRFDTEAVQDTYYVTPNHTAITVATGEEINRKEGSIPRLRDAASDSWTPYGLEVDSAYYFNNSGSSFFPNGDDFVIYTESGWPVVPQDIKDAAGMLVSDISCGKLDHIMKYVLEYETDQFKVKYSPLALSGTGNVLVDKILSNYVSDISYIGVL